MAEAPNPDAWRGTVRRRLIVVAVDLRRLGRGRPGHGSSGCRSHEHERLAAKAERQQIAHADAAGAARRRSSIATVACWRRRPTPTRSMPSRPRSTTPQATARKLCDVARRLLHVEGPVRGAGRAPVEAAAVHLRQAARLARGSRSGRGAQAGRRRVHEGEPPLLPDARADGAASSGYVGLDNKGLGGIEQSTTPSSAARTARRWSSPTPRATRSTASSGRRPPAPRSS